MFINQLITEGVVLEQGYGRVLSFQYPRFRVDERPRVLLLNRFRHRTSGNYDIEGINLNYLSDDQIERLRAALPEILASDKRHRYEVIKNVLPDIYKTAYRWYREDVITTVSPSTLRKLPSEKAREKAERERKWREMSPEEKVEYRKQAAKKAWETRKLTSAQRRAVAPEVPEEPAPEVPEEPAPEVPEEPAPEVPEEPAPEVHKEPAPEVHKEPETPPKTPPEETEYD